MTIYSMLGIPERRIRLVMTVTYICFMEMLLPNIGPSVSITI
nr:MAG TPA: hypothetical protein [Siphoviridae sp. ct7JV2]